MQTSRMPVQPRALRTRSALLSAGERLFARHGYEATTAKTIAAEAGVATGSFYQYFSDKDALLHDLARQRSEALLAQAQVAFATATAGERPRLLSDASRGALLQILGLVLKMHQDDSGLHGVMEQRRLCDAILAEVLTDAERCYRDMLGQALEHWSVAGDTKAKAFTLFHLVEGVIHGHVLGEPVVSDGQILATLSDAVLAIAASGDDGSG